MSLSAWVHRILTGQPYHEAEPPTPEEPEPIPYIPLSPEQRDPLRNGVKEVTQIAEDLAAGLAPSPVRIAHAEMLLRESTGNPISDLLADRDHRNTR